MKRSEAGSVTRYMRHSHKNIKVNTLNNTQTTERAYCTKCGKYKQLSDFYWENTKTKDRKKKTKPLRKCIQCDDARRLRDGKIQRAKLKGIYLDKNLQEINNLDKFMKVGI